MNYVRIRWVKQSEMELKMLRVRAEMSAPFS